VRWSHVDETSGLGIDPVAANPAAGKLKGDRPLVIRHRHRQIAIGRDAAASASLNEGSGEIKGR
jgi:hypothetical protein